MATGGRGGQTLKKTVRVITNDPKKKEIPLTLKVHIDRIYTLTPESVVFKGVEGEALKTVVRLVPGKVFPFVLNEIKAKRGENIRYQVAEIKEGKGVRYELTVENTRRAAGVYFDTLYLKTDSERKPEIQITVFGNISKAPDPPARKTGRVN